MLSPVSLRICWVAAMAPALTEAASQAENFNLACSPSATDLEFSALSLGVDFLEKGQRKLNTFSFMTLGQLASPCKADQGFENHLTNKFDSNSTVPALPWNNANRERLHSSKSNNIKNLNPAFKYGKCSNEVTLETNPLLILSSSRVAAAKPIVAPQQKQHHRIELSLQGVAKGPGQIYVQQRTMSKNITHLQDAMGLLNANTAALDTELKCKLSEDCIKQSAFSSHEQMLLFSDPEKQDRCTDIDLEVDDDKLPTEVSEALLKKLVASTPTTVTSTGIPAPPPPLLLPPGGKKQQSSTKNNDVTSGFHWTAMPPNVTPENKIQAMETCYHTLKNRAAQIIKRIRKLQMRQTEGHIDGQLRVLKDNRHKLLEIPHRRIQSKLATQNRLKKAEELLHSKEVKNLSTTALVDLVREIELSHAAGGGHGQSLLNNEIAAFESLQVAAEDNLHKQLVEEIKDPNYGQEICRTVAPLRGVIHHLESAVVDSDVTESSSGGESGDEAPTFSTQRGKNSYLHKRSYWRWTLDRAAVATRWVWLQAQISDLEYKIRQQNEVYRQLRLSKGGVILQETISPQKRRSTEFSSPQNVTNSSFDNKFNNGLLPGVTSSNQTKGTNRGDNHNSAINYHDQSNSLASRLHKSVNGFWTIEKPGNGIISKMGESSLSSAQERLCDDENQRTVNGTSNDSCRTRPLKCFKKRRVVRTMGLHFVNRRVSKLSSVRCHCNCQRDYMPCIICGGRYHSTQSIDPDTMPFAEKVSLIDQSFHPRLSLKHETQTGIQYENLLRRSEFQRATNRMSYGMKRKRGSILPSYSLTIQARKHSQKLTKNAAQTLLSSARIRKSLDGTSKRKRILREKRNSESQAKRVLVDSDNEGFSRRSRERRTTSCSVSSEGSKPCSPSPSPIPPNGDSVDYLQHTFGSTGKTGVGLEYRRRRLDDAYDINNIVIPYSIASATRLEKLQYKEILTPKWRVVESKEDEQTKEDEAEDISDELFLVRHQKCEEDEKKKFLSYVNVQGRSRSRSSRLDSRADSSGANTPDPMSPAQSDFILQDSCGWNSPVASPPPLSLHQTLPPPPPPSASVPLHLLGGTDELSSSLPTIGPPAPIATRRRTISLTKRSSEEERHVPLFPLTFGEYHFSLPYEMRSFPLDETEYDGMIKISSHLKEEAEAAKTDFSYTETPPLNSNGGSPQPEEDPNDPEWVAPLTATENI